MMNSLGDLLKGKSIQNPVMRGVQASLVVEKANNVLESLFGMSIKEHATVAYYKGEILCVACLSSTVAQEIKLYERQIINSVLEAFPGLPLRRITYML